MTRWILVRHAQSVANRDGVLAGHTDVPLTLEGYRDALALGRLLRPERIVRVVSSDLQRASETAKGALWGRAVGVRTLPALRERDAGAWTGRSWDELRRAGRIAALQRWTFRPPGGESLRDIAHRGLVALDALDDGAPTLVVAHGGLLRAILGLDAGRVDGTVGWRIPNVTPTVVERPRGHWGGLARTLEGP